jgi:glycosyltransferase involved in cell wall biosynthesis
VWNSGVENVFTDTLPRVLVVDGIPFSRTRNGGIVKSQLFAGWPKDRLCQITFSDREAAFDVCDKYWRLSQKGVVLGAFGRSPGRVISEMTKTEAAPAPAVYTRSARAQRLISWLSPEIKVPLNYWIFRLPAVLSPPLCEWIDAFRPQILFSFAASGIILRTVALIAERWKVNVVPYFGDDWVSTLYREYAAGALLRRSMHYWFERCLAAAPIRLTPSAAMSQEYEDRYGGRFEIMHYAEVVRSYSPPPQLPMVRFVFTGTLAPNRWSCLRMIGQALDSLAGEGLEAELLVYAFPEEWKQLENRNLPRSVKLAGTAPPGEVARLQAEANVLVHVESFDASSRAYTRLSLSTKIPQYFMAGRCVLAVGPAEGASIRYVSESGAGVAVTDDSIDALRNALRLLIRDESARRKYGETAYRVAVERNDETRQRHRFRKLLCAAAERQVIR